MDFTGIKITTGFDSDQPPAPVTLVNLQEIIKKLQGEGSARVNFFQTITSLLRKYPKPDSNNVQGLQDIVQLLTNLLVENKVIKPDDATNILSKFGKYFSFLGILKFIFLIFRSVANYQTWTECRRRHCPIDH